MKDIVLNDFMFPTENSIEFTLIEDCLVSETKHIRITAMDFEGDDLYQTTETAITRNQAQKLAEVLMTWVKEWDDADDQPN